MNSRPPLSFRVLRGGALLATERLAGDVIKIGSLPSSHLRIEGDALVSRMHAVIERSGDATHVIDLGSAAGTFVNGERVNKARLSDGDEVRVGDTRIVVQTAAIVPALPNPFAAPAAAPVRAVAAEVVHGIVARGAPVAADEVETAEDALEVVVMWGDTNVLHVDHVCPPRAYVVGEPGDGEPVDWLVGRETLGAERLPIVTDGPAGPAVLVPPGARATITEGGRELGLEALEAAGRLSPSRAVAGAREVVLPRGATARVEHAGLVFRVESTPAGRRVGVGLAALFASAALAPLVFVGVAFLVFGALLGVLYLSPPTPTALQLDLLDRDSRLARYMVDASEILEEPTPEWMTDAADEADGGEGQRHDGDEGQMGDRDADVTHNRYAIPGPRDNQERQLPREVAEQQAREAGALGVLAAMQNAFNVPTSPYGADRAVGSDPMAALGAIMGDQIGQNFGFGGLGMTGTGRGAGGTGHGTVGLGHFGTIGHGGGDGERDGYGHGAGQLTRRPEPRPPVLRVLPPTVHGGLSREVIRRVVHRNHNQIRHCYEQGLRGRPDLAGRVTMAFVIAPSGSVQTAAVASSDLSNAGVEACMSSAVRRFTFPQPDHGGVVSVRYPFLFSSPE